MSQIFGFSADYRVQLAVNLAKRIALGDDLLAKVLVNIPIQVGDQLGSAIG